MSAVYREAALRRRLWLVRGSQFGDQEPPSWNLEMQCSSFGGLGGADWGTGWRWPFPGVERRQMPRGRNGGTLAGRSACAEGCGASWISEI